MKAKKTSLILCMIILLIPLLLLCLLKRQEEAALAKESYQLDINCDEATRLPATFVTNNTQIQVSAPKGQPTVTVYLYHADDPNFINVLHLKGGQTAAFTNLSSAYEYAIGLKSEEQITARAELKVSYLPI